MCRIGFLAAALCLGQFVGVHALQTAATCGHYDQQVRDIETTITNATFSHWYNQSSLIAARFDSEDLDEVELFVEEATNATKKALGLDEVRRLQETMQTSGAVILHGVPLEKHLPLNPITGSNRFPKSTQISEASLVGVGQLFGEVLGYSVETSYSHPLVHDAFPVKSAAASAASSPRPQAYHQDMSYLHHTEVPDFFALLCLREGPVATRTGLIDNREVMRGVSAQSEAVLRDASAFVVKQPAWIESQMWQQRVVGNWTGAILDKPIISGPSSWPSIALRTNMDEVVPQSALAAEALKELLMAVEEAGNKSSGVLLRKGDVVVFDNKKMLHRRMDTKVNFDGLDRFLQRAYFHMKPSSLNRIGRIHQIARRVLEHEDSSLYDAGAQCQCRM